jgi:hypothetical protein
VKIVVGRNQELYLTAAGRIIDTEILFSVCHVSSENQLMDIDLFLPKRSIINPYINHIYILHSQETEVVTMLRFKRCGDIKSGVGTLPSYVYNR